MCQTPWSRIELLVNHGPAPETVPAPPGGPGGPPGPLGHLPPGHPLSGMGPLGPNYLDQIASIKAIYERNLAAVHAATGGGPGLPPSSGKRFNSSFAFDCQNSIAT